MPHVMAWNVISCNGPLIFNYFSALCVFKIFTIIITSIIFQYPTKYKYFTSSNRLKTRKAGFRTDSREDRE